MSATLHPTPPRRQGVEVIRLAAACAVVLIHFWPRLASSPYPALDSLLVGTSRFAVPFFFAASAYFLRNRLASFADGWRFARKWFRILILWHAIHAIWFTLSHLAQTPEPFLHTPIWLQYITSWNALFEGVAWPLWYLHSLVLCVLLASALPVRWRSGLLLPLGAALYALALLWGPWSHLAPAWMPHTPLFINPRGFLFTALLPFALGLCVAPRTRPLASVLVLTGLAIQTAEIISLPSLSVGNHHEYFLGSALLGVALLWFGLDWTPRWSGNIAWGAASLPMYILQLIVFSVIQRAVEWPLVQLFGSSWTIDVASVVIGILPYALFCHYLASKKMWIRVSQ